MLAPERYEYIIETLNRDSAVKVSKLIKELNVSVETIGERFRTFRKRRNIRTCLWWGSS